MAVERKDTDCKLVSKDGTEFHFHKTFLFHRTSYFEGVFKRGFSESTSNTLTLPAHSNKAIKNLQHFAYLGDIHPDSRERLEDLIETLLLANEFNITSLYNLSLDLISNFFLKNLVAENQEIEKMVYIILTLNLPNTLPLLTLCLRAAEGLEEGTEVRWNTIPPSQLPGLLRMASKCSFEKVASQLETTLSSLFEPALSVSAGAFSCGGAR